jgi:hypothetical protein
MADSRTEKILQAIVAALDAAGKPSGSTVNRSRRQAVEPSELPMFSVYPKEEAVKLATESRRTGVADRALTVQVRCRAAGTDEQLDPLRQWVVAALAADLSLGGLAINVVEMGGPWDAADASDNDYSVCEMDFSVRYTTARANLTLAA